MKCPGCQQENAPHAKFCLECGTPFSPASPGAGQLGESSAGLKQEIRELEHQLNDAGVETVIIFSGSTPTLAAVQSRTKIKNIIIVELGDLGQSVLPSPPVSPEITDYVRLPDALPQGAVELFKPVAIEPDDLIYLQYTGGTTGVSKGAMLSFL